MLHACMLSIEMLLIATELSKYAWDQFRLGYIFPTMRTYIWCEFMVPSVFEVNHLDADSMGDNTLIVWVSSVAAHQKPCTIGRVIDAVTDSLHMLVVPLDQTNQVGLFFLIRLTKRKG